MLDFNLFSPQRKTNLAFETRPTTLLLCEPQDSIAQSEAFVQALSRFENRDNLTLILVPNSVERNQYWLDELAQITDTDTLDILLIDEQVTTENIADLLLLSQYVLIADPNTQSQLLLQALACERQIITMASVSQWQDYIWSVDSAQSALQVLDNLMRLQVAPRASARAILNPDRSLNPAEFEQLAQRLLQTEIVALVFWGRSGSFFVQSLLDSHPEVLSIMGGRGYAMMEYYSKIWPALQQLGIYGLENAARHFCILTHASHPQSLFKRYPESLKRYLFSDEFPEREKIFIETFVRLGQALNPGLLQSQIPSKIFFLLMHYAFAASLNQDLRRKHIILYQVHGPENLSNLQASFQDFPQQKMLGTFRSPIRGLYSQLSRWTQTRQEKNPDYHQTDLLADGEYIKAYRHILMGWQQIEKHYQQPIYAMNLEKLHLQPTETMKNLAQWLRIEWHECLLESTAEGQPFVQESGVHQQINQNTSIFDPVRAQYQQWQQSFSSLDAFVLNGLLHKQLKQYDQQELSSLQQFLAKVFVFFPTRLELLCMQRFLIERDYRGLHHTFLSMIERWFYSYLFIGGYSFLATIENWNPNQLAPENQT